MNRAELQAELKKSYGKDLEQRKNWYSDVADAYNRVRPRYPQKLIDRAVKLAQLPKDAIVLEVGCGPGNATTSFAQMGFSMVCLEPSREACRLAQQNCQAYPKVEVINTSFEEWELQPRRFNAVLAANAWHWIPPKTSYPKATAALEDNGSLILLWNMSPQIPHEIYQALNEVYQAEAVPIQRYESRTTQEKILNSLGEDVIHSGQFKNLLCEHIPCEVTYSIDDYLLLLNTLSPYRALDSDKRDSLFQGLREMLEKNSSRKIEVSYLSAFHVAQKK